MLTRSFEDIIIEQFSTIMLNKNCGYTGLQLKY